MSDTSDQLTTKVCDMTRVCTAADTLARILPRMGDFGITRLADITGLDRIGLPVMLAVRPNARSIAISQGKGTTADHARASALMEAIEIWHAERITCPVRFASVDDLENAGEGLIDLSRLPPVPGGPLPRTVRFHWIAAEELFSGDNRLVPYEMVHADYTHPVAQDARFFAASTNGLASGNHRLEAICHGICEVVERDALAVWHHLPQASQAASQVDPCSISDPGLLASVQRFRAAGFDLRIWDIAWDIQIPSFMCVVLDGSAEGSHPGLGSGSHPDPVVAMHRALNEAAQTRLNYISGAREDLFEGEFNDETLNDRIAAFRALPTQDAPARAFDANAGIRAGTLEEMLDWLKDRLKAAGIHEIAVTDLTQAAHGIPVVRVIIPGLEAPHDDAAYVPGPRAKAAADRS